MFLLPVLHMRTAGKDLPSSFQKLQIQLCQSLAVTCCPLIFNLHLPCPISSHSLSPVPDHREQRFVLPLHCLLCGSCRLSRHPHQCHAVVASLMLPPGPGPRLYAYSTQNTGYRNMSSWQSSAQSMRRSIQSPSSLSWGELCNNTFH